MKEILFKSVLFILISISVYSTDLVKEESFLVDDPIFFDFQFYNNYPSIISENDAIVSLDNESTILLPERTRETDTIFYHDIYHDSIICIIGIPYSNSIYSYNINKQEESVIKIPIDNNHYYNIFEKVFWVNKNTIIFEAFNSIDDSVEIVVFDIKEKTKRIIAKGELLDFNIDVNSCLYKENIDGKEMLVLYNLSTKNSISFPMKRIDDGTIISHNEIIGFIYSWEKERNTFFYGYNGFIEEVDFNTNILRGRYIPKINMLLCEIKNDDQGELALFSIQNSLVPK